MKATMEERRSVASTTMHLFIISFFFFAMAAIAMASSSAATGFSLELIYKSNYRDVDVNHTGLGLSMADDNDIATLRPVLYREDTSVEVKVKIGSNKKPYNMLLDTGSGMILVKSGRRRNDYDPSKSSSYKKINNVGFSLEYKGGDKVKGDLSMDDFTLNAGDSSGIVVSQMIFGCVNKVKGRKDTWMGILAMNRLRTSFVPQLGDRAGGVFSYCVPRKAGNDAARSGFLQFGSDIHLLPNDVQRTSFVGEPSIGNYYLSLEKISINGKEVVASTMTERNWLGVIKTVEVKTFIDTGYGYTLLNKAAYREVKDIIVDHFRDLVNNDIIRPMEKLKLDMLCYLTPTASTFNYDLHLPRIIFVFGNGAFLAVDGRDAFEIKPHFFCLALVEAESPVNIIGLHQQQNRRFIYNLNSNELTFAWEDCSQDRRHQDRVFNGSSTH